jgi:hypothetical protein
VFEVVDGRNVNGRFDRRFGCVAAKRPVKPLTKAEVMGLAAMLANNFGDGDEKRLNQQAPHWYFLEGKLIRRAVRLLAIRVSKYARN